MFSVKLLSLSVVRLFSSVTDVLWQLPENTYFLPVLCFAYLLTSQIIAIYLIAQNPSILPIAPAYVHAISTVLLDMYLLIDSGDLQRQNLLQIKILRSPNYSRLAWDKP